MAHHGAQPEQVARKIRNGHVYARFGNDSLRRRRNGGQSKKHSGKSKVSHHYGDYAFEISMTTGEIVGADYEVDEEYLDTLGGSPVSIQEAVSIVQSKVPGSPAEDIRIWEESDDGRGRYEGELFFNNIKYEFEIDPPTGIIFDWNADLRL